MLRDKNIQVFRFKAKSKPLTEDNKIIKCMPPAFAIFFHASIKIFQQSNRIKHNQKMAVN